MKHNKIKTEGVMKKKILSYVLAVALTMSSFAGASFAVNIAEEAAKVGSGVGAGGALTPNKGVKFVPNAETQAETDKIVGLITQVFNYAFGILTTTVNANRGITVYDEGRQRATYGYNPGNGSYTLTSFNLFGGNKDLGKINAAGGIENFLKKMGASDAMLTTEKQSFTVGDDGSVSTSETPETMDEYQSEPVAWLGTLVETLKKGVNHSVSINFMGQGGATLTVAENGKPQFVLGPQSGADGNPVMLSTFIYNEGGFLVARSDLAYELKDGPNQVTSDQKTGNSYTHAEMNDLAGQNDANLEFVATHHLTYYDPYGRESYKTNSAGDILSRNSYSSNGALNYSHDLTTGNRTYYENGRESFVVNDKGYTTAKFNYHQNGTMDTMVSYNYGVATHTTVYDFGKQLGTISNDNENGHSANDIRAAYYKMMRSDNVKEMGQIYKDFNFVSVEFYAEFLNNQALLTFFGFDPVAKAKEMEEEETKALQEQRDAKNTISSLRITDAERKLIEDYNKEGLTDEEKEQAEAALKANSRAWNYAKAQGQASDAADRANRNSKANRDAAVRDINKALYRMKNCNNGYASVASIAGAINNSTEEVVGETVDAGITTARVDGGTNTTSKQKTRVTTVEKEVLSFSITVKDRGQNAFAMEGAKHTLSEKRTDRWDESETTTFQADPPRNTDPALVFTVGEDPYVVTKPNGEVANFTKKDENGKDIALEGDELREAIKAYMSDPANAGANFYVKVSVDDIYMMDGTGNFLDADGEEMYIKVPVGMMDDFAAGDELMAMGDARIETMINSDGIAENKYVLEYRSDYTITTDDGVTHSGLVRGRDAINNAKDVFAGTNIGSGSMGDKLNQNVLDNQILFGRNGLLGFINDWKEGGQEAWKLLAGNR